MIREHLREALEPLVIKHHADTDTLHKLLLPIAVEHFGDMVGVRNLKEFEELSADWNDTMADIVQDNNLGRQ